MTAIRSGRSEAALSRRRKDDGEAPKCKPPACIDAYVEVTGVTAHNIAQTAIGPKGTTTVWQDQRTVIDDELKDRLKKKFFVDGKRRHVVEECGETCTCVKTFQKEKDANGKGAKQTYPAANVTIYIDKDGKFVDKTSKDAICKLEFEITVEIDIYGYSGVCRYSKSEPI